MDGHTSKAAEKAKVMWERRVHWGHLSEHDWASLTSVYLQNVFAPAKLKALRAKDKPSAFSQLAKPAQP